ncbi:hypothetical protein ACP4OV_022991 [Aristida adscensionis]
MAGDGAAAAAAAVRVAAGTTSSRCFLDLRGACGGLHAHCRV